MPDYSVAEFRHETFICTESIAKGRDRFRVFMYQGSAHKGHQKASELLRSEQGNVKVDVDESTGDVTITKGNATITGHILTLQ